MATGTETGLGVAELALVTADLLIGKTFRTAISRMDDKVSLEFDALVSGTYTGTSEITDHPVEGLLDVSDHIRRKPKQLTLRGIVSNNPIIALASFTAKPVADGFDPATRAEDAFRFLEETKDQGRLCHVLTSMWEMESMAICALSCTRDKDTGNIADLQVTLREVQVAATQSIDTPDISPSLTKLNLGRQATVAASSAVAVNAASFIAAIAVLEVV